LTAHVRQVAAHRCGALATQLTVRVSPQVPPLRGGERGCRAAGGLDTLLGPEETDPSAPETRAFWAGVVGGWVVSSWCAGSDAVRRLVWLVWWSRLFFENCTVDASISEQEPFVGFCSLLRFVDRFVCSSF
jgi:hypothetical protein